MSELLFPFFGALLVVVSVLPACAGVAKLALLALERAAGHALVRFGAARYLLLVVPTFFPIAWAISAGLHQAESGKSVLACLIAHDLHELCLEPLLFGSLLAAVVAVRSFGWLSVYRRASVVPRGRSPAAAARVAALIAAHPKLAALAGRFVVTDGSIGGTATLGLLRPFVAVDGAFAERCDDDALLGALAHELEHLRGRDPLRYFLLGLALRLNPLGDKLLRREALAWLFQREVQCDRAAVSIGARPTSVARALLEASRPVHVSLAHLRGGDARKLRLRVELLLAYAERRPADDSRQGAWALSFTLVAAISALVLPHLGTTDPLDLLHTSIERVASAVLN